MRALAIELIDYFNEQGYWFDMGIYVDGERWSSNLVKPSDDAVNYDDYNLLFKLDKKFLNKYGLYFEQGYAWSMAAYEV